MPEIASLVSDGSGRTDGKTQVSPDHWSAFLRCTICFGFLESPHTLECGHSFCKRCLKRLAEIGREDSPTLSFRRLNLTCPTCRHPFRARPAYSGRIHTCILLKQLVEHWKKECQQIASTSIQNFRSMGCQTQMVGVRLKKERDKEREKERDKEMDKERDKERDKDKSRDKERMKSEAQPAVGDEEEEAFTRMVLDRHFCDVILKRVIEALDELNPDTPSNPNNAKSDIGTTDENRRADQSDSELSDVSSVSDANAGSSNNPSLSNISLPERLSRVGLPRMVYMSTDNCPGRLLLMAVWSIYSLVIVALAEASLPYVILFTLFFFLLVLR